MLWSASRQTDWTMSSLDSRRRIAGPACKRTYARSLGRWLSRSDSRAARSPRAAFETRVRSSTAMDPTFVPRKLRSGGSSGSGRRAVGRAGRGTSHPPARRIGGPCRRSPLHENRRRTARGRRRRGAAGLRAPRLARIPTIAGGLARGPRGADRPPRGGPSPTIGGAARPRRASGRFPAHAEPTQRQEPPAPSPRAFPTKLQGPQPPPPRAGTSNNMWHRSRTAAPALSGSVSRSTRTPSSSWTTSVVSFPTRRRDRRCGPSSPRCSRGSVFVGMAARSTPSWRSCASTTRRGSRKLGSRRWHSSAPPTRGSRSNRSSGHFRAEASSSAPSASSRAWPAPMPIKRSSGSSRRPPMKPRGSSSSSSSTSRDLDSALEAFRWLSAQAQPVRLKAANKIDNYRSEALRAFVAEWLGFERDEEVRKALGAATQKMQQSGNWSAKKAIGPRTSTTRPATTPMPGPRARPTWASSGSSSPIRRRCGRARCGSSKSPPRGRSRA